MIRRCWISDSKSAGTKEKIEMYKFTIPDNVVFGVNAVEKLDRFFPEDVRTLIISGRSAKNNGIVDRIAEILAPRPVAFFCNVEPEPTIQQVDEVRELFCKFNRVRRAGSRSERKQGLVSLTVRITAFSE